MRAAYSKMAQSYAGHSGAPWTIGEEVGSDCGQYEFLPIVDANGKEVAFLQVPFNKDEAPIRANARLIAAALQMLEALKVVQTGLEERAEMYGMESDALRLVRAASAAATGEAV